MRLVCPMCRHSFNKEDKEVRRRERKGYRREDLCCGHACAMEWVHKFQRGIILRKSKFTFDREGVERNRDLMSYFLGFCCADGTMVRDRKWLVGYLSSDEQIIQDLTVAMKYDHKPRFDLPRKEGNLGCWANFFYADNARWWIERGLKSKDQLDLEDFDVDLYPFLRGHMDGDGSLKLRKVAAGVSLESVQFLARERMVASIVWALKQRGFHPASWLSTWERGEEPLWVCILSGGEGMSLLKCMYGGATVFLKRKKEDFDRVVASGY